MTSMNPPKMNNDEPYISDDEEDDWFIGPALKRRRAFRVVEDDEEEECPMNGSLPETKNEDEVDPCSDDSVSTEIISGLKEEDADDEVMLSGCPANDDQEESGNQDKPDSNLRSKYTTPSPLADSDEDEELLSIASSDELEVVMSKDSDDSDETCFETSPLALPARPRPARQSTSRTLQLKKPCRRPVTADDEDSDDSDTTAFDAISDSEEDPNFDPQVVASSDSDLSEDDANDGFKKVARGKAVNRKSLQPASVVITSCDEDEDDDDAPIPQARRDRFQPNNPVPSPWHDMDLNFDTPPASAPPIYNPSEVRKEHWHGDVQRTVTMLDETIQTMPMPDDGESEDMKFPPGLVELYGHQQYALRWMSWREGQFPGGGILADEMGLGKTIEVIALIMKSKWETAKTGSSNAVRSSKETGRCVLSRSTLVVSPLGCIPQWCREIETKGKDLSVYTYHGSKKLKSAAEIAKYDVVITTYQTIALEIPKIVEPPKPCHSPLKRVQWLRIVLDEAHQIRNPKTRAAAAIFQLEATHRWAVTGTPIHNRPEDFYSMCAFLRLTPFDDRGVWDFWIGLKRVKRFTGAEKRLHILGKALILRRTKEEVGLSNDSKVKVIPPKNVEIVSVELSDEERQVYDLLMEYARNILREFLSQKEQREHGLQIGGLIYAADRVQERRENCPQDIKFSHIFALLIRLRQCAVLPHLIETMLHAEEVGTDEPELEDLKPEHIVSKKNPIFNRLYVSSKFQKILDDVDELRAKGEENNQPMDKVIIVSSWTSTLDVMYEHLRNKGYTCVFITGRDNMDVRMLNMDSFNKKRGRPEILLLSLMAGGVGLNLVGANHVFFIEPHWNPQHELQAQDRVHRFGQTKDVFIRRYIAEDTIESRIMDLQEQKIELANGLLSNAKNRRGAGITLEQMKHLFDVHNRHHHDDYY